MASWHAECSSGRSPTHSAEATGVKPEVACYECRGQSRAMILQDNKHRQL